MPEDDAEEELGDGSSQVDIGEYADSLGLAPTEVGKQPLPSSSGQTSCTKQRHLPWNLPRQQTPTSSPLSVVPWETIQQSELNNLEDHDEQSKERICYARKPALATPVKILSAKHCRKRSHVSDSDEEENIHSQYILRERLTSPSFSPPLSEPLSRKYLPSLKLKEQTSSQSNGSLLALPTSPRGPPTKRRKLNEAANTPELAEFDFDRPQNDFDEEPHLIGGSVYEPDDEKEQFIQTKLPLFTEAYYSLSDFAHEELNWRGEPKLKTISDQQSLYQKVDELRRKYRVDPSIIVGLLHRTSFRLDILDVVLHGYAEKGAEFELSRDIVGVFTIQDDEDLATNDPQAIKRVQERHGKDLAAWRIRYWEIFGVIHRRERP
ncbi:hypothetical protein POJ06DRAFT_142722 [Lipomyces tetrasporus]|uniref:TRF2-interacting telomeric protein/Rap1 C-terminal domain-containing protein n=1 Tax=Lipomyces tetrasporus TaxID=54092 RepID=A0AAD7QNZ8_9ASCO|nr:uncharacterized protein POJ06DRAFT_142722 [Lipomyces tetrasporus]KAJ8098818.1 hypothetical protein POJ06DRAFT_142722 [Lipomyces tetrasporus]